MERQKKAVFMMLEVYILKKEYIKITTRKSPKNGRKKLSCTKRAMRVSVMNKIIVIMKYFGFMALWYLEIV